MGQGGHLGQDEVLLVGTHHAGRWEVAEGHNQFLVLPPDPSIETTEGTFQPWKQLRIQHATGVSLLIWT